jgi:hypothetical protein
VSQGGSVAQWRKKKHASERLACAGTWPDHDLIFTRPSGKPIDGRNFPRLYFFPFLKRAGLPRLRFHELRHGAATIALHEGVPLATGVYVLVEGPIEDPTLNLVSGALIELGGGLLWVWLGIGVLIARLRRQETPPHSDLVALTDEPFDASQTVELVLPQTWHEAALTVVIPVLICTGGVVGVVGLVVDGRYLDVQYHLAAVLLSMCSLLGATAFAARLPNGLRSVTRIQATPQGLRSIDRRQRLFIPWEQVESVRVRTIQGRPTTYAASADQGRITLEWSATGMPARPREGASAITAAALAHVAAQRAGVSVVREELTETPL